MKRELFILIILLLGSPAIMALELPGKVIDTEGLPIEGVTIVTDVTGIGATTDSEGKFVLPFDDAVTRVTFSHVSYKPRQFILEMLPKAVTLERIFIRGEDIIVTAGRAQTGLSPVAFDNYSKEEIERDYTIGDLPLLLESTPNMYAFSYSGGSLGATEYKIRGFDSKRIAVYINGVPLNDPEDHSTYFVDIPDFASEVTDIQVQRGVGMSMYGDASFGGSVNISSNSLIRTRKVTLTSGFGGYYEGNNYIGDMRKQSVEYSTGIIDGRWSFAGRYSKQYSDGYREQSWFDGWAYFFSVSRLDPKMTTTINVYGGPIKYHMAWWGISRDDLDTNRRYNPTSYENQTDNFNQPHYELHHTCEIGENLNLKNTLYYIRGKGYYEQFKEGRKFVEYNISPEAVVDTSTRGDLVRQKWVTKNQYGWNPQLEWTHDRGEATLGGSIYYFDSEHWGQVVWGEKLTGALSPRHRYYEYFGEKYQLSVFADERYHITDQLTLTGSLQLKHLRFRFEQTKMGAFTECYEYDLKWLFLSPRFGLNYTLNDKTNLFFNFALSSREPDDGTIYDADDPDAKPAVHNTELTIDNERLYDLELGGNYREKNIDVNANIYWMEFCNEIIPSGALDDDGAPILGNADRSVHAGVELSGSYRTHEYLTLSGNVSFSYNRIKDYCVYKDTDWNGVADDTVDYSGNPVAGFPDYIANLLIDSRVDPLRFVFRLRSVGRQYTENSGRKDVSIDPYLVASMSTSICMGEVSDYGRFVLSGRVDNLFNEKYESYGLTDDWGSYYIPASERSFYVQLKWEME